VSQGLGLIIESLVAFLLLLTIGYCAMLNRRLKRLQADEHSFKVTIAELITATEMAERAVEGLRLAAHECEGALGERLEAAGQVSAELDRKLAAGDVVLARLSRVVTAARPLEDAPAPPRAADPQAVAEAARSFADRLRERVAALAA
jgi:hypothetical protein